MSAFGVPRPEAVHIFGTDRLSTEDLLGYFTAERLAPPSSVEWINDSSAKTPNAQGVDTTSWHM